MFCHAGGIIRRIIIAVIVKERTFRERQIPKLYGKFVVMRVLDERTVVNCGRICRFAVSLKLSRRRPLFVELDIYIEVKGRCVAMALFIVINDIAGLSVEFDLTRELDFGISRKNRDGSEADKQDGHQTFVHFISPMTVIFILL